MKQFITAYSNLKSVWFVFRFLFSLEDPSMD